METENTLVVGFSPEDESRVNTHLHKLFSHLRGDFAVVGGLAIRYHLISRGISYPLRPFNDLDLIACRPSVVQPSVTRDFLVYHYHPEKDGQFYIVLVDPESRTKIDIFDYQVAPEKVVRVPFGRYQVGVVSIEDQLVKTVLDIQRISEDARVDPKQFQDTELLLTIADLDLANRYWKKKHPDKYPQDLLGAISRAQEIRRVHPEWVQEKPFRKPKPYRCPGCVNTKDFPLSPMEKIYRILGYVE